MSQRTIIFGISGVGKTRACLDYVRRHPGVLYMNIGQLLSDSTGLSIDQLNVSNEIDVLSRQGILKQIDLHESSEADVLIDAHSVIDTGQEIVPIPVQFVRLLRPTSMVLLEADANQIQLRREQDSRLRPSRSQEDLRAQMDLIRKVVEGYSVELRVPLVIVQASAGFQLDAALRALH